MRIVITGAKGQLGRQLVNLLSPHHQVKGYDVVDGFDVCDYTQTMDTFLSDQPDLIIHSAALTKVDYCAEHPDEALWINGYGTQHVAYVARELNARVLYISTNEVFDGTNTDCYLEHDPTRPINAYGYSKWVGEQVIQQLLSQFYIVRVSWLFGHGGRNFVHVIRQLAEEGKNLRVVVNEVAVPTYVDDFAQALSQLIETPYYGIYHLVNEGRASRWEFARHILDLSGFANTPITKISAAEYPRPSTPPEYGVLRNYIGARRGIVLRDWREAVAAFLEKDAQLNALQS
jgi:dTDP-4-dehydrorhamnose reductase